MRGRCLYGFGLLLLLWAGGSLLGLVHPLLIPPPWQVARELLRALCDPDVAHDLLLTVMRIAAGFLIASGFGISVGALLARRKPLSDIFFPLIEFFRSLPAVALIPLFLVLFGIGETPKILLAALAAGFIILVGSFYSVKNVRVERLLTAKWLQATNAQVFFKVILWDAMPGVIGSLRQGFSVALIVVLVSEMLMGGTGGLGLRIYEASLLYRMGHMYAMVVLAGLLGYLGNRLMESLERAFVHWTGR